MSIGGLNSNRVCIPLLFLKVSPFKPCICPWKLGNLGKKINVSLGVRKISIWLLGSNEFWSGGLGVCHEWRAKSHLCGGGESFCDSWVDSFRFCLVQVFKFAFVVLLWINVDLDLESRSTRIESSIEHGFLDLLWDSSKRELLAFIHDVAGTWNLLETVRFCWSHLCL